MTIRITDLTVRDIRFPTSRERHGSDAVNVDPDYSAAVAVLETDAPGGLEGHGLTFTLGRGTEVCVAMIRSLAPRVVGETLEAITEDFAGFWRRLAQDSQWRWLGPEKGVVHLATAAVVNAVWDLWGKAEGKPVWKLLADLSPERWISLIDFRHITDALTPDEALEILQRNAPTRPLREAEMLRDGFPAYTTSAGWLGYPDETIRRLCREGVQKGWTHFKIKVGSDPGDDRRRLAAVREEIGPRRKLMLDANQKWDVEEAIRRVKELAAFDPWWIEEPTNPDDILGHAAIARAVAPIGVASGEVCPNRVLFKQFFQTRALRFAQPDPCRLGGINEMLAVLLMAAKFEIPVCPHAGGVGLGEQIRHLSIADYICVGASLEGRVAEYVDHLHEHFADPAEVRNARYQAPRKPGLSTEMLPASVRDYEYPSGRIWRGGD